MDASTPMSADLQRQQDRKRKRKAILAGGVVLGLGAAVTLAAWSDDVFANGTFNTGGFELQGSTDGTNFQNYDGPDTTPPVGENASATLSFGLNDALKMTPSQTVYTPLTIATSPDTDHAGDVYISNVSATGKYAAILTYNVYETATHGANCSATGAKDLKDEWTDPVTTVGGYVDGILNFSPDGGTTKPLAGLSTILSPLIATVGETVNLGASPVFGPAANTLLDPMEVGAEASTPKHLCIAVTLGVPAPPLILGLPNPLNLINQTTVTAADQINTDDTVVTWEFTGNSK